MRFKIIALFAIIIINLIGCQKNTPTPVTPNPIKMEVEEKENNDNLLKGVDYFIPHIDLNNCKVTLSVGNPTEVKPPEILDYASNGLLASFMYNDSIDGYIVFYCSPGSSTNNSSYFVGTS